MTGRGEPLDRPWRAFGVDEASLPRHVAIIMDGNGRWAERRNMPRTEGHRAGTESVRRVIRAAVPLGLPALTLYTFSTENWKRPSDEVAFLWDLCVEVFRSDLPELKANGVRVRVIGDRDAVPARAAQALAEAERETAENRRLVATFAVNYGGRDDIARAARRIAEEAAAGRLDPAAVGEREV
ncbi:MAG: di-trans,poly-cis-decaprenylcistransferase, partial [Dactylosporangium sp.]|nr:di-trans,poly-cis-decaprenylcistransferase [Dactylosporangium sp.]